MNWINVNQDLPKENQIVLVCDSHGEILISKMDYRSTQKEIIQETKSGLLGDSTTLKEKTTLRIRWNNLCVNTFTDGLIVHTEGICIPTGRIITHWMNLPQLPTK